MKCKISKLVRKPIGTFMTFGTPAAYSLYPFSPDQLHPILKIFIIFDFKSPCHESLQIWGASVKDADSVRNIAVILKKYSDDLVVVISAMGKTTNAFERVLNAWLLGDKSIACSESDEIRNYHLGIAGELIPDKGHALFDELNNIFTGVEKRLKSDPAGTYNQEYDQLVSLGEILSTIIVSNLSELYRTQ